MGVQPASVTLTDRTGRGEWLEGEVQWQFLVDI